MAFRKYGGLNYAASNNIIRNHYGNSDNFTVSNVVGQYNSKIVSESHFDMSANSLLNVESIYFMDGSVLSGGTENGNLAVAGSLTVAGNSLLNGPVETGSNASIGNNFVVAGTSNFIKDVTIGGNLGITGLSNLQADVTIGGNLTVDGTSAIVDLGSGSAYAPTPTNSNSNQIATTGFFSSNYASLNSPNFTGIPTAPTASLGTNTDQIATTAFVQSGWKFVQYTSATFGDTYSWNYNTGYSSSTYTVTVAGFLYNMKNNKDRGSYYIGAYTYIQDGTWWVTAETYLTLDTDTGEDTNAVLVNVNCLVIPIASEIINL